MKKVLIVDDSALMRRVLSDIINDDEQLIVEKTANNGLEALNVLQGGCRPDILLVDINMPKMDGVQLLKELNKYRIQIPVLIVSSIASQSADETIEALALGAFDFVKKPNGSIGGGYQEFRKKVLLRTYMACKLPLPKKVEQSILEQQLQVQSQSKNVESQTEKKVKKTAKKKVPKSGRGSGGLAVIASSTGGPRALQSVIPYFPKDFPLPLVVVQHMPAGFTASLAARLNEMSDINVKEAADGDVIKKGWVYIAPGGKHIRIEKKGTDSVIKLSTEPPIEGLRPCANVMYESLTSSNYDEITCVVLTGMGADGTNGIKALNKNHKNIYVIAQDEETSVVYGMPKAIAGTGLVNEVVPLNRVAEAITKNVGVS